MGLQLVMRSKIERGTPGYARLFPWMQRQRALGNRVLVAASAEIMLLGKDRQGNLIQNGMGGLGIQRIAEATTAGDPRMNLKQVGLLNVSLAHTAGKGRQVIRGRKQFMEPTPWEIEGNDYFLPLGAMMLSPLGFRDEVEEAREIHGYLYEPSIREDGTGSPIVLLQSNLPGVTDVFYPDNASQQSLLSQVVLGGGAFSMLELLSEQGVDGTAVVHDCHGGLFPFSMFLSVLENRGLYQILLQQGFSYLMTEKRAEWEQALAEVRRRCITTIHAPQPGTVNKFGPNVLGSVFLSSVTDLLYQLGPDRHVVNMLHLPIELSGAFTMVSPLHYEITMDDRNGLLPPHFLLRARDRKKLAGVTANAVNPFDWLSPSRQAVYERYVPGSLTNPDVWRDPQRPDRVSALLRGKLLNDLEFKRALVASREVDRAALMELLQERGIEVPEGAILVAAMRRATAYKLGQLNRLLDSQFDKLVGLGRKYGPVFLLLGGIAPERDNESEFALSTLLGHVDRLNREGGEVQAAFFQNYNEYDAPKILAGVDVWGMFSDATTDDVTLYEAFGPSGAKAQINGALCVAASGSWTAHYNDDGEAVFMFGHHLHAHGYDLGPEMRELLAYQPIKLAERKETAGDFIKVFGDCLAQAREERELISAGEGELARALNRRINSIVNGLFHFHPVRLLREYREFAEAIRALPLEVVVNSCINPNFFKEG